MIPDGADKGLKEGWEPQLIGFLCRWCSYAGADLAGTSRKGYPANLRIIRVPCSSRVDALLIIKALRLGFDGVLVAGCHPGECHYLTGNYYTRRRLTLTRQFLEYLGVPPERLRVSWVAASEGNKFAELVTRMTEEIRALGPNRLFSDE
jgi:F420-non-reducing hydrogenase iron-sulfur subunit